MFTFTADVVHTLTVIVILFIIIFLFPKLLARLKNKFFQLNGEEKIILHDLKETEKKLIEAISNGNKEKISLAQRDFEKARDKCVNISLIKIVFLG